MKVLDLFSGAVGAWSLGMHRAGFQTIAACEADPWRRAIYAHNNPGIPIYEDVRAVTADRLRRDLGELPPVIVGSPPCQDASSANTKGRGVEGERTGLFFEAIRIVRECRARWVAFENSPMLRTRGYDRLYDAFQQAGYTCWPVVVGADDLEAPHERKRVWIVAFNPEGIRPVCWRPRRHGAEGLAGASTTGDDSHTDRDAGCLRASTSNHDRDGVARQRAPQAADANGGQQRVEPRRGDGSGWPAAAGAEPNSPEPVADMQGDGCRPGLKGRPDPGPPGQQDEQLAQAGDPHSAGSSIGESLGGDARAQFEALERTIGSAVHTWNGGVARHLRMAHGVAARLADIRVPDHKHPGATINAAKACISAHGDAILPQIAEAIGRSILRTEAALAAVGSR